jgi:hypothetical protein
VLLPSYQYSRVSGMFALLKSFFSGGRKSDDGSSTTDAPSSMIEEPAQHETNIDLKISPEPVYSGMVPLSTDEHCRKSAPSASNEPRIGNSSSKKRRFAHVTQEDSHFQTETFTTQGLNHVDCRPEKNSRILPPETVLSAVTAPTETTEAVCRWEPETVLSAEEILPNENEAKKHPGGVRERVAGSILLVHPKDRGLVKDSLFVAMEQMEICQVKQEDIFGRYKHTRVVGYAGLQCKHCKGHANRGRYFPPSLTALIHETSRRILWHTEICRDSPASVRSAFSAFRRQEEQKSESRHLTNGEYARRKRFFFQTIWMRLHGDQEPREMSESMDDLESLADSEHVQPDLLSPHAGTVHQKKTCKNVVDPRSSTYVPNQQQKTGILTTETAALCFAINNNERPSGTVTTGPSFPCIRASPAEGQSITKISAFQCCPCKNRLVSASSLEVSQREASSPQTANEEVLADEAHPNITADRLPENVCSAVNADTTDETGQSFYPCDIAALVSGSTLVYLDDRGLVSDSMFVAFGQLEVCHVPQADGFYLSTRGVGYAGVQCKHCKGRRSAGRCFPPSLLGFTHNDSHRVLWHAEHCNDFPTSIRDALLAFKRIEVKSSAEWLRITGTRLRCQQEFFRRVWCRLRGADIPLSTGIAPAPRRLIRDFEHSRTSAPFTNLDGQQQQHPPQEARSTPPTSTVSSPRRLTRDFEHARSRTSAPSSNLDGQLQQHPQQEASSTSSTTSVSSRSSDNEENRATPPATVEPPRYGGTAPASCAPMIRNDPSLDGSVAEAEEPSRSVQITAAPKAVDEQSQPVALATLACVRQATAIPASCTPTILNVPQEKDPSRSVHFAPMPVAVGEQSHPLRLVPLHRNTTQFTPFHCDQAFVSSCLPPSIPGPSIQYLVFPNLSVATNPTVWQPSSGPNQNTPCVYILAPISTTDKAHAGLVSEPDVAAPATRPASSSGQYFVAPLNNDNRLRAQEDEALQDAKSTPGPYQNQQTSINCSHQPDIQASETLASGGYDNCLPPGSMSVPYQATAALLPEDSQQAWQDHQKMAPSGQGHGFPCSPPTSYPMATVTPLPVFCDYTQPQQWAVTPANTYFLIAPSPNVPTTPSTKYHSGV